MSEAVSMQRDKRAAEDREQAQADPGGNQRRKRAGGQALGQRVDDAAEQDRFGKLSPRQRQVCQCEQPGEPCFVTEQRKDAGIDAYKVHVMLRTVTGSPQCSVVPAALASLAPRNDAPTPR